MLNKREVKDALWQYNIRPSKRLGQNFLIDQNIRDKIIDTLELADRDTIVEIGAGLGGLTEGLCQKSKKVIAVEKDKRLCEFLKDRFQGLKNLEIVCEDFLKFCLPKDKTKVIGNLPFYITTPILTRLIEERKNVSSIFITVQKEFADRIVAKVGQSSYSPITLFVQFYCLPKRLFSIRPTSFFPSPEVDATFLKLEVLEKPLFLVKNEEKLFRVIRRAFGKRRKTILNALSTSNLCKTKSQILEVLKNLGINPQFRPEGLSMEEYVKISEDIPHLLSIQVFNKNT